MGGGFLESFYKELSSSFLEHYIGRKSYFIIHKGFKITKFHKYHSRYKKAVKFGDKCGKYVYVFEDCRHSDFYNIVSIEQISFIISMGGIIKGIDTLYYREDLRKIKECSESIASLYKKRARATKALSVEQEADVVEYTRINKKRVRLSNKNITTLANYLFIYNKRVTDYNKKYNKN